MRTTLQDFHSKIVAHCGVPEAHISAKEQLEDNQGIVKKVQELVKLIGTSQKSFKNNFNENSRISRLQEIIKTVLIKWAREGIKGSELTEKIFLLLHRQFNETEELINALNSTYVVEKLSDVCSDGIVQFMNSLGYIRNVLKIGMGEKEEKLLENKLKLSCIISSCYYVILILYCLGLFSKVPSSLGTHTFFD